MIDINLMPATTGTRTLGGMPIGTWHTSELSRPGCSQSTVQAPNHLPIAGVVPATGAVSARPFAGIAATDAARKRGRPPRGNPC